MTTQSANSTYSGKSIPDATVVSLPHNAEGVKCDGGSGPLGHPVVYYKFDGKLQVTCGYCGRKFLRG